MTTSFHATRADRRILRCMVEIQAVVFDDGAQDILPVYARGDRRTKPAEWMTRESFLRLRGLGDLVPLRNGNNNSNGYGVAAGAAKRVTNPVPQRALSEQHLGRAARDIYTPDHVVRSVRISKTGSSLRRLSRQKHGDGTPVLSPAMIEAGERFARDYARAHGGDITTQNYGAPMIEGGDGPGDKAAAKMAHQIDASGRLARAVAAMGGGLDRVVIAVCCNDYDLAKLERDEKWAVRSGMVVLQLGLSRLVDFYGTVPGARADRPSAAPLQPRS